MKKIYFLALLGIFIAFNSQCSLEQKKVFFINGTDDAFYIKGPFNVKDRFVPQVLLETDQVDVAEFQASNSDILKVQFMRTGSRFSRDNNVAKEFSMKFPKPYTAMIFTKTVQVDKSGEEQPIYHVLKADAFTEAKLSDSKSF